MYCDLTEQKWYIFLSFWGNEKKKKTQIFRTKDIFGPVTNATVIVAIQCHNRLQYLRQLVISLSQGTIHILRNILLKT